MQRARNFQPVIIIGAARSGTNMLRDLLVELPAVGTWPCDEINYIWRHFNAAHPDDEFPPELATPRVRDYLRQSFARQRVALVRPFWSKKLVQTHFASTLSAGCFQRPNSFSWCGTGAMSWLLR